MTAQLTLSLDNLEAVLGAADMSLADLVRLDVHAADVDLPRRRGRTRLAAGPGRSARLLRHYGVPAARWGAAAVAPATTMPGVTRLAVPGRMVESEGTAVA